MSDPEPGWHADPAGTAGSYRWWDGQAWTRWLSSDREAPAPEVAVPAQVQAEPPGPRSAQVGSERLVRLPVAVAVVAGALLVAVLAVSAVVAVGAEGLPSGPALAPPSRSSAPTVGYDPGTRAVSVGKLKVTLPAAPYACDRSVGSAPPTFASGVACSAPVHANYDGKGGDWTATVVVGVLPSAQVQPNDLKATATAAFASARGQFFTRDKTTVTKLTAQPTDLGAGSRTMLISGEVHYRVPQVPSRYDRLLVVVVALPDGTHAVIASSRPNDSGQEVQRVLQASLDTAAFR